MSLRPRLKRGQIFSHASAAVLLGIPIPRRLERGDVHISAFRPVLPPRLRGVSAHELDYVGQSICKIDGLPSLGPADTWLHLAAQLSDDDLIAAGDFLVTGSEPFSGLPPPSSLDLLAEAVARCPRRRGVAKARQALELIKYGPLSPRETKVRLLMHRAGLPEPLLNHNVLDSSGRRIGMVDLALPEPRLAIEYQGEHHRTDPDVYNSDILRRERLEAIGWSVIYVTKRDLARDPEGLIRRIRARITS